ncbi:MAG TPA: hypothetical protein VKT77_07110, partial [Chthonomonadaceae bacterium]|nr:hypothetical protein [Chthonomonadaceae bacterium]
MLVYSISASCRTVPTDEVREPDWNRARRRYARDPAAYAREVLGVKWWAKQVEVAEALLQHRRVFVKASHAVGKSFLAAGLVNWFFDCFDPSICITTAPNAPQVRDILWKEVRVQRPWDRRGTLQPKAPRMETSPDHFAVGFTSRDGSGFQGRHEAHVFIVFDECIGVAAPFWDAAEGMMTGDGCYFLALCNPTDTASRAYIECRNTEKWRVIEISAMDHPNIAAELAGRRAPYPKAVRLGWVRDRIREWCTELGNRQSAAGNRGERPDGSDATDGNHDDLRLPIGALEFPPSSGRWFRPGPLYESRVLGRWPTQGSVSVWSEAAWAAALTARPLEMAERLAIGCDVARYGDDFTSIVARRGSRVLHHETHNGWSTAQTAGRLKELAWELARTADRRGALPPEEPEQTPIHIDDDGVGGGVTDQAGDFNFIAVKGASRAIEPYAYPNRRSELWFAAAARAADGRLDLSALAPESLQLIERQVMAPKWSLD